MRDALLFLKNFLTNPARMGSFLPSSTHLVADMLAGVDFSSARLIVEYGPGTGVFTEQILKRLHPDARFVCIEVAEDFYSDLKARYADPRMELIHGSAADVRKHLARLELEGPDAVISGLPFTSLPDALRHEILIETCQIMGPQTIFLLYQYTRYMTGHLEHYFGDIARAHTLMNVPPAYRFTCRAPRPEAIAAARAETAAP